MRWKSKLCGCVVLWSVCVLGCEEHGEHEHGDDEGHGHAHAPHLEQHTSWGRRTQVMVEHAELAANESITLTVHVTDLKTHRPLDGAQLEVKVSVVGMPEGVAMAQRMSPGIYVVALGGLAEGEYELEVSLRDGMGELDTHRLGGMRVGEMEHEEHHEGELEISLEEQWRMPFGVSEARTRRIRPHITAFAQWTLPGYKEASITAPRDGRVLAPEALEERLSVGQEFEAGEVVLEMTTSSVASADPAALDLAVEQASLRLGAAQKEVDRITPLVEQGVVASKRLTAAELERDVARAALRSARRQKASLSGSQRLDQRRDAIALPSPIAGRLGQVHVVPGAWVEQGDHLASVIDDGELWLDVDVPEAYVSQLEEVRGVWFEVGGEVMELGKEELISVGPSLHRGKRTLPVRFRVKQPEGKRLFAGMTTRAHVMTREARQAVAVSTDAVVVQDGKKVVYVQRGAQEFELRQVRVGERDGEWVEVIEGIEEGEWVVVEGVNAVRLAGVQDQEIGHGHAH